MVYMSGGKAARNQASIINRANCGGPKKMGLMGGIGSIGTGGISPNQSRRFCPSNSCNNRDMNTLFGLKCRGNFSNPSQSTARMAQRDARERELIPLIREKMGEMTDQITIVVESLPLGDIIFSKDEDDLLIIERKNVADLAASIKDGRYQEQSYRLDGTALHNHNIVYLIEGNMARVTFDKSALYSAMFSLQYYKGFSVWRTFSIDETAVVICNSIKYLAKSTKVGYYLTTPSMTIDSSGNSSCGSIGTDKDYVSVIKTIKKDNVTPNNIGEIMLCQIPGISANTALAIMEHFKCMINLIADLQEQGAACLEKVELKNAKGQSRKLNKTCIANIVKFLLQE